ncbi:non-ribosomal peptide synthetase [Cohnella faecalis]|uniref:non-ribosomal peptide synthetase n=1 Tax=Cohnella faecalis TaxID=2315694 RepID=UPI0011C22D6C|nr:non-ribosomal peptide synthetase [Cohnella faecalis]
MQPIGIPGELCIAGAGLARGYLNQPELTAEKFVANPFAPGERMYRTGDLARWLPDGNIEYLGRIDEQVKVRGHRIELGEVESALRSHESVKEATVIARKDEEGSAYLCAYFVTNGNLGASELRKHLLKMLPQYMIPSFFVRVEQMPLTPNGKLDRKALPSPEGTLERGTVYEAPRNALEETLANIWQGVLGVSAIGITDNFFELGGHSLKATTLVSRIHKELNVQVPLREVFQSPTIKELAQAIRGMEAHAYASIEPAPLREYYPVSSAQKRMYILSQLQGADESYNMPGAVMMEGKVDRERFERAFRQLIARHEALRTSFEWVEGEPAQRIHLEVDFEISYKKAEEDGLRQIAEFIRAFDLGQAPLLRVGLLELEPERQVLLYDMHHIISDGVSMDILVREFVGLYGGQTLPAPRLQYKDYAVWQQAFMQSEAMKRQETYWLETFSGELPVLEMPTDYPRPAVQSFKGDQIQFELDGELSAGLNRIAAETGTTLYMVLLAGYSVLLSKYTGQEDIVVGTPIAGRPHADVENIIGMFVNTLAMRSRPAGEKTFTAYLQEVKEVALQAYEHQEYPFEELVEKLNVRRDLSRNPIFDTMFSLQNMSEEETEIEEMRFSPYGFEHSASKFDMSLTAVETGREIGLSLSYCTAIYTKETAERLGRHYVALLRDISSQTEKQLKAIELLSAEEKRQLLHAFNDTKATYPANQTIHGLFEEQVKKTPDHTAVVLESESLTYAELNGRANQLARVLRGKGVGADRIVGILAERSLEMIVGILGILKAGGAYLPIDPDYPAERIGYMLEDSGADILLTQKRLEAQTMGFAGEVLHVDDERLYAWMTPISRIRQFQRSGVCDLYFGLHGEAEGRHDNHQGLVNYVSWANTVYMQEDRLDSALFSSISFDLTVTSLYLPLITGNKVVVYHGENQASVIKRIIEEDKVGLLKLTPSHLKLLETDMHLSSSTSMKRLIVGGEDFSHALAQSIYEKYEGKVEIYNEYGPTETVVGCTVYLFDAGSKGYTSVPIGVPASNVQIYILNSYMQEVPIGVAGEMYISGDGVSRGYLNQPELTAEKFVANPFAPGERMYRTGDLARWLPDGNIEYLGRIDEQVKVRGHRIELGEVESALRSHESVKEATVIARKDEEGSAYLCAYFVANGNLGAAELRKRLSEMLPNT